MTVDREDSIERLLKRGRPTADASSELCLDPETIGAWLDGTLLPAQRAAAETHAADCSRCQSVLAAMVRTEPPKEHQAWWRSGALRWIAPLALAEAALLAWLIVVPSRPEVPVQQAAKNVDAVASTAEPSPRDEAAAKHAAAPTPADTLSRRREPSRERQNRPASAPPLAATAVPPVAAPVAPPLAAPTAPPVAARAAPPVAAPAAQEEMRADRQRAEAFAAPPATANEVLRKAGAAAPLDVASPDRRFAWRVLPTGVVERTTDGGATWTAQEALPRFAIQAGRSPAPDVIWLVGNDGLVLVSTDGRTWQRRSVGQPVSLVAVSPVDGVTATVTAADGRKFVTHDAGVTWSHLPPQENPAAPF